jgi:hypothetical protein
VTQSDASRARAYRRRRQFAERDRGKPWLGLEGEEREQAIRDRWGYTASETRTEAERSEAAARMVVGAQVDGDLRERYLADAEAGARLAHAERARNPNPSVPLEPVEERVQRALNYAAWRWDGFHAGEIASL